MVIATAGFTLTATSACSGIVDHFSGPYDPGTAQVGDCFAGKHAPMGGTREPEKHGALRGSRRVLPGFGDPWQWQERRLPHRSQRRGLLSKWCRSRQVQHQLLRGRREDFLPALAPTELARVLALELVFCDHG